MSMPEHLVLIRHGESEGNVATRAARKGDESAFTDEFVTIPGRKWALTAKGRAQAECVGAWLMDEKRSGSFSRTGIGHSETLARYFASPFTRTKQTAAHLWLLDLDWRDPKTGESRSVRWRLNRTLRERDWGDIETIPQRVFQSDPAYSLNARKKEIDPLYWRPPGGESICDVAENRVRNFLDTLHRECSSHAVFTVTHGEFMRATRLVLERADDETYESWDDDPAQKIHNCEVIHYSRRVPERGFLGRFEQPGAPSRCWPIRERITYVRRARPVEQADGSFVMQADPWSEISFTEPTNAELLT